MKPLQLDIIHQKSLTKTFTRIGWGLLVFGMGLTFLVLTNDWEFVRKTPILLYVLGVGPAAVGLVITGVIQATNPSQKVGSITITEDEIRIISHSDDSRIEMSDISEISLRIEGYEMQAKQPWILYLRSVQSNHYGNSNLLAITMKNGTEMSSHFFLENGKMESYLGHHLKTLSEKHGFKLIAAKDK